MINLSIFEPKLEDGRTFHKIIESIKEIVNEYNFTN